MLKDKVHFQEQSNSRICSRIIKSLIEGNYWLFVTQGFHIKIKLSIKLEFGLHRNIQLSTEVMYNLYSYPSLTPQLSIMNQVFFLKQDTRN